MSDMPEKLHAGVRFGKMVWMRDDPLKELVYTTQYTRTDIHNAVVAETDRYKAALEWIAQIKTFEQIEAGRPEGSYSPEPIHVLEAIQKACKVKAQQALGGDDAG